MPSRPDIHIAPDGQAWAQKAAGLLHAISEQTIRSQGRIVLALSGGSTPTTLYRTLAQPEWKRQLDWPRVHFLFGDERCVPPDHPESNFAVADRELFQPVGITAAHISRMKGEWPDPAVAAREYEETLRTVTECPPPAIPRIDLILLGLGEDGHTASLFPGTQALDERARLVTVGHAPTGIRLRLTLTLGVINRASVILFLVAGEGKASMVRRVIERRSEADRVLPAARVWPEWGRLN
jgi:6-phosphogluconolactonase